MNSYAKFSANSETQCFFEEHEQSFQGAARPRSFSCYVKGADWLPCARLKGILNAGIRTESRAFVKDYIFFYDFSELIQIDSNELNLISLLHFLSMG